MSLTPEELKYYMKVSHDLTEARFSGKIATRLLKESASTIDQLIKGYQNLCNEYRVYMEQSMGLMDDRDKPCPRCGRTDPPKQLS
jgi:hypothetical protein